MRLSDTKNLEGLKLLISATYARKHMEKWYPWHMLKKFVQLDLHTKLAQPTCFLQIFLCQFLQELASKFAGMLMRPGILRPRPEVRGQDQRARGRDRGQRFEAENEAQIMCKNRIVIPKHSSTMRWIKSESDRAFHWIHPRWHRLSEFPVTTAI